MTAGLPTLAIELAASRLGPADVFALRLVCKELNLITFHYFSRMYFYTLRTVLSRRDLQALNGISQYEQLMHQVQTLLIARRWGGIGSSVTWNRHPSGQLIAHSEGRDELREDELRDILLNLVDCRSFQIRRNIESERIYESNCLAPSDAISIILSIAAETELAIKSFHANFNHAPNTVDAKRLQTPRYQRSQFGIAWAHVQNLSLKYGLLIDTLNWSTELVLHAANLQKLHLYPG